jgi:hypothetical protein
MNWEVIVEESIVETAAPYELRNLSSMDIATILQQQFGILKYLTQPVEENPGKDHEFVASQQLWEAVRAEELRASSVVTLRRFLLFEWFPRSPGLYYTQGAAIARREAVDWLVGTDRLADLREANVPDEGAGMPYTDSELPDHQLIFEPRGKFSMLEGGIGSIRLKDKVVEGERVWFMCASSSAVAHQGFPVALPDALYQRLIDRLATEGSIPCTLKGRLRFLPDTFDAVFDNYSRVPKVYLHVEHLEPLRVDDLPVETASQEPQVSVAASFISDYQGPGRMYATYVTFYPGRKHSLARRVDWLEEKYVKGLYQGQIVTDFDEQMRRFDTAVFSLKKLVNNGLDSKEVEQWWDRSGMNGWDSAQVVIHSVAQLHMEGIGGIKMEKVINIGNNATVNAPVVIAEHIQNSFNAIKDSSAGDDVKQLLEHLILQVNEASKAAPGEATESMARDVETLSKEVASASPRKKWYELSIDGLKEAAVAVGEVGKPILETVGKLAPMLAQLFPA